MSFTSLIPINSASGVASTPRAIAAGAFERVGLKYPGGDHIPAGCEMRVLVPDDMGDYKTVMVMDTGNIARFHRSALRLVLRLRSDNAGLSLDAPEAERAIRRVWTSIRGCCSQPDYLFVTTRGAR